MEPSSPLVIKAGPAALRRLQTEGFRLDRIELVLGAAGGPKWLVLSALDRWLAQTLGSRSEGAPLHLCGASSGAWRLACYGTRSPRQALARLEEAYIEQDYPPSMSPREIRARALEVVTHALGPGGAEEVLSHPRLRTHVLASGTRGPVASERLPVQLGGLVAASLANLVHRRALGLFLWRALFSDPRGALPVDLAGLPTRVLALRPDNLEQVVMASGSIPLRVEGTRSIAGAPPAVYRDGALLEYHMDLPSRGLVLYPHFVPYLVPSWLDRLVPWRRVRPQTVEHMILVHPSRDFEARLPGGKLPDITDFARLTPRRRLEVWREAARRGEELCQAFQEWVERPDLSQVELLTPAGSRPWSGPGWGRLRGYLP